MHTLAILSAAAVPVTITGVTLFALVKKVDVYESFVSGAKKGLSVSFRVLPYMVSMIFAIRMLEASGGFDLFCSLISPAVSALGLPPQAVPVMVMRPFSGGASLALLAGALNTYGADSYIGRTLSTYMGSSETLFYTASLYFGSAGVKKTRYVIPVALFTDLFGMILSCLICRWL